MEIPRPSQEVQDEMDAALVEVLAEYVRAPYEGVPRGLFSHVEQIVRRLHPDWADFKVAVMASAATADIVAEIYVVAQAVEPKNVTWKEI